MRKFRIIQRSGCIHNAKEKISYSGIYLQEKHWYGWSTKQDHDECEIRFDTIELAEEYAKHLAFPSFKIEIIKELTF